MTACKAFVENGRISFAPLNESDGVPVDGLVKFFQTIAETGYESWHGDIILGDGVETEGFVVSVDKQDTPSPATVPVIPQRLSDEAMYLLYPPEYSDHENAEVFEATIVTIALNSFAKRIDMI